jgi:hypothetical protein
MGGAAEFGEDWADGVVWFSSYSDPVGSIRIECLEYALAAGEQFGIWGRVTSRQRRTMRRRRDAQSWWRWKYWKEVTIVATDHALVEIRSHARLLYEYWDGISILRPDELAAKSFRLAQLVNSLDETLCGGAELPTSWRISKSQGRT